MFAQVGFGCHGCHGCLLDPRALQTLSGIRTLSNCARSAPSTLPHLSTRCRIAAPVAASLHPLLHLCTRCRRPPQECRARLDASLLWQCGACTSCSTRRTTRTCCGDSPCSWSSIQQPKAAAFYESQCCRRRTGSRLCSTAFGSRRRRRQWRRVGGGQERPSLPLSLSPSSHQSSRSRAQTACGTCLAPCPRLCLFAGGRVANQRAGTIFGIGHRAPLTSCRNQNNSEGRHQQGSPQQCSRSEPPLCAPACRGRCEPQRANPSGSSCHRFTTGKTPQAARTKCWCCSAVDRTKCWCCSAVDRTKCWC
jgi:hypothetical protein